MKHTFFPELDCQLLPRVAGPLACLGLAQRLAATTCRTAGARSASAGVAIASADSASRRGWPTANAGTNTAGKLRQLGLFGAATGNSATPRNSTGYTHVSVSPGT